MNRKKLTHLLRVSGTDTGEPTRFCPDDEAIAGFVDGGLAASAHQSIAHHLTECAACVARVGRLTRLMRPASESGVASINNQFIRRRRLTSWAAAASVVLTFGFLGVFLLITGPDTDFRDTRSSGSGLPLVRIQAPEAGLSVQAGSVIEWTAVPDSTYYEVRIVSDVGDIVRSIRVDDTEYQINGLSDLEPGRDYFVRVEARLPDNRSFTSDHVLLRISRP